MKRPPLLFLLLATAALASGLRPTAAAAGDPPVPGADATPLPRYVVAGVPLEASVNPLTRASSAALGEARDPLATPLAVKMPT